MAETSVGVFTYERSTAQYHVFVQRTEGRYPNKQYIPKTAFEAGVAPSAIEILVRPAVTLQAVREA